MAKKVLNEQEMREFVEQEVRNALLKESIDENFMANMLSKLLMGNGAQNGIGKVLPGFSWETLAGAVLGKVAVAPLIEKLLVSLGIPADSPFSKFIIHTATTTVGAYVGDWIDKNHNLIGKSNAPANE